MPSPFIFLKPPHFQQPGTYDAWVFGQGVTGEWSGGGCIVKPIDGSAPTFTNEYVSLRKTTQIKPGTHSQRGVVSAVLEAILSVPPGSTIRLHVQESFVSYYLSGSAAELIGAEARGWKKKRGGRVGIQDIWEQVLKAIRGRQPLTIELPPHDYIEDVPAFNAIKARLRLKHGDEVANAKKG